MIEFGITIIQIITLKEIENREIIKTNQDRNR